mgnify:CR=1 FL=1
MPERVTPEERLVSLAIEKARKAAEVLRQREPTQVKEVEHEAEDAKLKRPKAQADKTKIKTQSEETHSGYGLAGQEMKKAKFRGPPQKDAGYSKTLGGVMGIHRMMNYSIKELSEDPDVKDNYNVKELIRFNERFKEVLMELQKYGRAGDKTGFTRDDEKYFSNEPYR